MRLKEDRSGFTLIEVISVLVIMGVISAVVISKTSSTSEYSLASEVDIFKMNFRYAQAKALNSTGNIWGLSIAADGKSYTLTENGIASVKAKLPADDSNTHAISKGISITTGAGAIFRFDDYGSPGAAAATIVLTDGANPKTLTVTANTGYLQ
jgi:MSHA pilin protein MshC